MSFSRFTNFNRTFCIICSNRLFFTWYEFKLLFISIYKYSNFFYFTICMESYNTVVFIKSILTRISFRLLEETWKEFNSIPTKLTETVSIDLTYNTIGIFCIIKTFRIRISCVSII